MPLTDFPSRSQVFVETLTPAFSPVAALAVAPKSGGGVKEIGTVDPDGTCLDAPCNIEGKVDIFTPDAGGKAIVGVIGQRHRLIGGAEGHGDKHRPKDLDLSDSGSRRNLGKERRWEEI